MLTVGVSVEDLLLVVAAVVVGEADAAEVVRADVVEDLLLVAAAVVVEADGEDVEGGTGHTKVPPLPSVSVEQDSMFYITLIQLIAP